MFENIGLGGVFTFDEKKGVQAMGQARDEFGRFKKASDDVTAAMPGLGGALARAMNQLKGTIGGVKMGVDQIGGALKNAAIAAIPIGTAFGFAAKTAIDFERQMGAVNAATGATPEEFARLEAAAKKAGASTVFSATESASAMELLAKAGFDVNQTLTALPGVMAAAAAESIDLSQATDIVAQVLRGMNLEIEKSTHVANTLAMAAAKTNTSIPELGESFKYGGAQARSLGYTLEQTAAVFGVLADAGLKGSIGGTAFGSMLNGIVKPSRKAQAALDGLGITTRMLRDDKGALLEPTKLIGVLTGKLEAVKQPADRARLATLIFGTEGARAYNAFAARGVKALDTLTDALKGSDKGIGFAAEQAEKRLDNFAGAFKLFGASMQAASIEIFGPLLQPFAKSLREVTTNMNAVIQVVQDLAGAQGDVFEEQARLQSNTNKYGTTVVSVALGIRDAIAYVKEAWTSLTDQVKQLAARFKSTLGEDNTRQLTKWGLIISLVTGLVLPLVAVFGALAFVVTAVVIPAITGLFTIIGAVFWPALAVAAALYASWDSLGGILSGLWSGVKAAALPVIEAIRASMEQLWTAVKFAFSSIGEAFGLTTSDMETDWKEIGMTAVNVIGAIVVAIADFISYAVVTFSFLVRIVIKVGQAIEDAINFPLKVLLQTFDRVATGFKQIFVGNIWEGLKTIALGITDFILSPIRLLVQTIVKLAEAVPGVKVPEGIKTFAERGLTGLTEGGRVQPTGQLKSRSAAFANAATNLKAAEKEQKQTPPEVKADVKIEDKRVIETHTTLSIDGENIGKSVQRHKQEIQERAGFKATPWQRRMAVEHGAAPIRKGT